MWGDPQLCTVMYPTCVLLLHQRLMNEETCENDETGEDDKASDNEVEECTWVLKELEKSGLGYQGTLVSLRPELLKDK